MNPLYKPDRKKGIKKAGEFLYFFLLSGFRAVTFFICLYFFQLLIELKYFCSSSTVIPSLSKNTAILEYLPRDFPSSMINFQVSSQVPGTWKASSSVGPSTRSRIIFLVMDTCLPVPAHRQLHLIDICLVIKFLLLTAQFDAPQIGKPCVLRVFNIDRFDVAVIRINRGIDQKLILQDFQRAQIMAYK